MRLGVVPVIVLVLLAVNGIADTVADLQALGDGLAQSPEQRVLRFPDDQTHNRVFYVVPDDQKRTEWWWPNFPDLSAAIPARGQVTVDADQPLGLMIKSTAYKNPLCVLDDLAPDDLHTLIIYGDDSGNHPMIVDDNVDACIRQTHLKCLILNHAVVSDRAIEKLKGMDNIERLCFISKLLDDEAVEQIAQMEGLKGLRVFGQIGNKSLASIATVDGLEELFVNGRFLGDEGIRHISTMKTLNKLFLGKCNFTEQGLQCLTEMDALENLHLLGFEIGPEGAGHIANIPNLMHFRTNRPISDQAAEGLKKSRSLKELELARGMQQGYDLSDAGLKSLSEINSLESLSIYYGRFTDAGLKQLSALSNLKRLSMPNTSISEEAEKYLIENLPSLEECEFRKDYLSRKTKDETESNQASGQAVKGGNIGIAEATQIFDRSNRPHPVVRPDTKAEKKVNRDLCVAADIVANWITQEEMRETVVDFRGRVNYGEDLPIDCKTKTIEIFFVKVSLHRDEIRAKVFYRFSDGRSDGDVLFRFSFLDGSGKLIDSQTHSEVRIRDIPVIGYGKFKREKDKPNREGCVGFKFDLSRVNEIAEFRLEVLD